MNVWRRPVEGNLPAASWVWSCGREALAKGLHRAKCSDLRCGGGEKANLKLGGTQNGLCPGPSGSDCAVATGWSPAMGRTWDVAVRTGEFPAPVSAIGPHPFVVTCDPLRSGGEQRGIFLCVPPHFLLSLWRWSKSFSVRKVQIQAQVVL